MIVVDTNVVSEPLKPAPNVQVLNWLDRQKKETLFLTSTVLSQIITGIERLPEDRRKESFRINAEKLIASIFGNRILPFDAEAARKFAAIVSSAAKAGKAIQIADGQIAAVALTNGFSIATRDVAPFEAAGLKIINPWITD